MTELAALRTEGLLTKLMLLKGHKKLAYGFDALEIPPIDIEGLFLQSNLSPGQVGTPKKERRANKERQTLSSASVPEPIGLGEAMYPAGAASQNGNGLGASMVRYCLASDIEVRCSFMSMQPFLYR